MVGNVTEGEAPGLAGAPGTKPRPDPIIREPGSPRPSPFGLQVHQFVAWRTSNQGSPSGSVLVPVATVILSISIVLAPKLGASPVAAASVFWFLALALQAGLVARRIRQLNFALWILVIATLLAALRMSSAGLVQLVSDRPTLFWNVDWRYAATQAQGIARFGDLGDSLDYAGEPVQYHVGPSWIAGSLNHVLGIPVNGVLLVAVPVASIVVIALCGHRLLRLLGAPRTAAAIALTALLSLPNSPYLLLRKIYGSFRGQAPLEEVLTDAEQWWFSPDIMANSLFAIALGLSAAVLLVGAANNWRVIIGALGLASLLAIKPQYLIGLFAVLGIGLLSEWWRGEAPLKRIACFISAFAIGAVAVARFNPSAISFTALEFSFGPGMFRAFDPRFALLSVAAMLIVGLLARRGWRGSHSGALASYAIGAAIGAVVLVITLGATTFLVDAEAVARANAVGLPYTRASQDPNLDQALRPVTMVLVVLATALLVGHCQKQAVVPRWLTALSCILVVGTLPLTVAPLAEPTGTAAYEVSEEGDLGRLMSLTPENKGRWLSNDMADPAQDFARPLRATSLTSFSSEQFYVSNIAYMGWTQPDVVQRMRNVQRFFLSEWSPWHRDFLTENDVAYIIIRDRCPVAWPAELSGPVVGTAGAWTLVRANVDAVAQSGLDESRRYAPHGPRYGLSGCLEGSGPRP